MNVLVLGNLSGIGGEIANQLARLGHEAYAMPGVVAVEILAGLRPQLIIPVSTETGMTTNTVSRLIAETQAAVIVVASPGNAWATWAEHLRYPVIPPERAAEEIATRLSELMAHIQATEQARYLQTIYGAPVVVTSQPRVVGFGGPKGGTGKSTVAANAAALLAARGVSIHVIDAESDTRGNQPDLFRLGDGMPIYSILELASAGPPPSRTGGVFEPGAHVPIFWSQVPSPRGIRWNLRLTAGLLTLDPIIGERSLTVLARAADWLDFAIERATSEGYTVILDTGNNLMSPLSLRAINRSQVLYIVLEPEDTGLIAGASWLAHVYRIAGPDAFSNKIRIVFNKVRGESGSELVGRLREHVETILGHRLPRAMPVQILPFLDIDIARAQTSFRLGVEHLAVLQFLTNGRYAEETREFTNVLQSMLSELFPILGVAPSPRESSPRFRFPWRK
ncbi:MAG: hypothetical protein RMK32_00705 [Anaerolineae bacterium]|nr:hypothetical protein [Thermoflexus sp.]MDW8064135.1 hypothetical protein [Anaerolineae bacterium]